MYFPLGWPKVLRLDPDIVSLKEICCNRERILFAVLTDNAISIWYCRYHVPLVSYIRTQDSIEDLGTNDKLEWRSDSSMIVVSTTGGCLMFFKLGTDDSVKTLYELADSATLSLQRDNDDLFIKERIPAIHLVLEREVNVGGGIVTMVCIRDELMISTVRNHVLRYRWDGTLNRDYCLDLGRIPFCIDRQVFKAVPIFEQNKYITKMDYSPLAGGFAIVFNDGRAAVLTASTLKFDPNQVQGIWAPNIEDASCCSTNHRYRLIAFGRKNSEAIVYTIDEQTGGLEISHTLVVSSHVYPGEVGPVECMEWSPDGRALALSWSTGGFSIWSTFGALLVCSLGWNYGLHVDLSKNNPLLITSMEWSTEGYYLWMINKPTSTEVTSVAQESIIQYEFLKSALTANPCMSHQTHLFLQGADKLYVNLGSGGLTKVYQMSKPSDSSRDRVTVTSTLVESKQWVIIPVPATYLSTTWPVRYAAIDNDGKFIAVAGRFGLAHYSMITHKWNIFRNETQEKDMVVSGGLLWWRSCIIAGCYSEPDDQDQIRIYPREPQLSNRYMTAVVLSSQIFLIDSLWDKLIVYCADGKLSMYSMSVLETHSSGNVVVDIECIQMIDISTLHIHPACVISVTLTALKSDPRHSEQIRNNSFILNVSGRLFLVNQQDEISENNHVIPAPILLASCVENVWVPSKSRKEKPHLTEALWLFCGSHGMKVWLPLFPKDGNNSHTYMSKRIMLPFKLKIYPLAILFEDAILLGAENDTTLYSSDPNSIFSLPFNILERTSQVYLHQVLRQLIRRNLGFHAWEVARCCENLPYFPHSLELLLHEVLEEEATSKEPIPDAQLPSVIEFIQEFPVYLKTVVQCARKTEIALWPYLFSAAGKPKDLFQECLTKGHLETASSYLIILQNLESSSVSRQYAALLLDATLENEKWELSKDLVRFFRAIDPNDTDNRTNAPGKLNCSTQTPTVQPNEEDLSYLLSSVQVTRGRSFSTATQPKVESVGTKSVTGHSSSSSRSQSRKKSAPSFSKPDKNQESNTPREEFFLDVILQRHARRLLTSNRLKALGYFAAHLDFRLVEWLHRERESAARVDNFITALKDLHSDFSWPYPVISQPLNNFSHRKMSSSISGGPSLLFEKPQTFSVTQSNDLNSAVGDSGYMSCQDHLPPRTQDVGLQIQPHVFDVRSVISEGDEAAWWAEEEHCSTDSWSEIPCVHLLEKFSSESPRGSNKADVQLRYLLQIFMEAGCLDWCLLMSVLLRDVLAIHRVSNAARSPDQSHEAVVRLREGFLALFNWSNAE
ncbi:guanine nucleotide exchange factor subunit Rich isoform X2 [Planococcus citri]